MLITMIVTMLTFLMTITLTMHHLEAESHCKADNDKPCAERDRAACSDTEREEREMKRSRLRGEADSLVGKEVKEMTSGQLVAGVWWLSY